MGTVISPISTIVMGHNDNAEGYYCIADVGKCTGGDVTYCTNLEGKSPIKQKSLSIINGDEDNSEDIDYVADERSYNGENDTNFRSSHYANDSECLSIKAISHDG